MPPSSPLALVSTASLAVIHLLAGLVDAHPYAADLVDYNLNTNQDPSAGILDFTAGWPEKQTGGYTPSPTNWRALPCFTVLLDKFADGDPTNNDFFDTRFEWDESSTQLRYGGDIVGFAADRVLDYIYGMGYRLIYFAGTAWINMPWQSDQYSALDFTLLDPHLGTLDQWRAAIDKIHLRGMYVMLDMTTTTMGDLIGVLKYLNTSAPFDVQGYEVEFKRPHYTPWDLSIYRDFNISNNFDTSCKFPTFWDATGSVVTDTGDPKGCYTGDFDQFGDTEAFGVHPDWQRQLSKFASVQDRLREWDPTVASKLEKLACLTIQALDPDGFRIDKATQQTVDFVGQWGGAVKTCAKSFGKGNFFIPGEITGGNTFGSLYIGRGRVPANYNNLSFEQAYQVQATDSDRFLRAQGQNGLDSAAFHYSVWRSLTRFLSMDGNLEVAYDVPVNWVTAWNIISTSNDFLNWGTGEVDPRHLYGTTNQDVFRWPALTNGTQKMLLGMLVTNLVMPGIPLAYYGEEQNMYVLDNTADNYIFGRQAMTGNRAWQTHGCYRLGSQQFFNMPLDKALDGCSDDWNSLDHYDPTAPVKQVMSHFTYLRTQYPALLDGFNLVQLGNWTTWAQLPGSNTTQTEWGLWSITRSGLINQTLPGPNGNVTVWMLYSNLNETRTFEYDCGTALWISAPYPAPMTVRNLMYPYENYTLADSLSPYYLDGKAPFRGCLPSITMDPLGFKVLVPQANWVHPLPKLVSFLPGHDARISSTGGNDDIKLTLGFSDIMTCATVTSALTVAVSGGAHAPSIDPGSVSCGPVAPPPSAVAAVPQAVWQWTGTLSQAPDGLYEIVLKNVTNTAGVATGAIDHLMLRKGTSDNVMVFPDSAYSSTLLSGTAGSPVINSAAVGADQMRWSLDFGQTWSPWQAYASSINMPAVSAPANQTWKGVHVKVQYWSALAGSSAHVVDGDLDWSGDARRFPQLWLRGPYDQWGFDAGIDSSFKPDNAGNWSLDVMTAWPNYFQLAPFGVTDDLYYGDVDGDGALDRLPPNTLASNYLNLSKPLSGHLGWRVMINQDNFTWGLAPIGSATIAVIMFWLLAVIPPFTAWLACFLFRRAYYGIRMNKYGFKEKKGFTLVPFLESMKNHMAEKHDEKAGEFGALANGLGAVMGISSGKRWPDDMTQRRKVLIATLEYEIIDWKLKVKIGGLGVMSSLMGKSMHDVQLLWVVPKVKDLEYPQGDPAPPIVVTIFGEEYHIELQTHQYDTITYYLLDSPVFRANTKSDPYPARMDDLSSAIFYSTWNQCIAEVARRNPDLTIYHINDYHGTLAPFYLLPTILPVCCSLHNAEFQGLWPLRTKQETDEVCRAFNIPLDVCQKYVQFGNVFNLLHASASFISIHQKSVGVAGVSDKYGKRSWARYPALWTLKTIDSLPNPDPTDIEALDESPRNMKDVQIDEKAEADRPEHKRQAQEWAGLEQRADAELFVFVGRWSLQKGVDLIADVFPGILEKNPKVQLIAVGPQVDLYGIFAAHKLAQLMVMYPGRVFSKPEFTALPPFIFSGGDFALIPSRDEPFGLVAVEFGRKGALGVGSRLGGLGLMPGWWYPVESDSTAHMHRQFAKTIKAALKSTQQERAVLRARSALQRFPVLEWRHRLEDMHKRSVKASRKYAGALAWGGQGKSAVPPAVDLPHPDVPHRPPLPSPTTHTSFYESKIPFGRAEQADRHDMPQVVADSSPQASMDLGGHLASPHGLLSPSRPSRLSSMTDMGSTYSGDDDRDRSFGPSSRQSSASDLVSMYGDDEGRLYANSGLESPGLSRTGVPGFFDHQAAASTDTLDVVVTRNDGNDGSFLHQANSQLQRSLTRKLTTKYGRRAVKDPFMGTATQEERTLNPIEEGDDALVPPSRPFGRRNKRDSFESINSVMKQHDESPLNKAIENFTDEGGAVRQDFIAQLSDLNTSNSMSTLCIAEYLSKAEKDFFKHARDEKLAAAKSQLETGSIRSSLLPPRRPPSPVHTPSHSVFDLGSDDDDPNHPLTRPVTLTRWQVRLQQDMWGWPVYTILLALGQMISATSFQLSLLSGSSSQSNFDLYVIGAASIPGSVFWYILNHLRPATYALALPWVCFGVAFILVGVPSLADSLKGYAIRHAITLTAASFYSFASSAGFLFFSSNFGEEAGGGAETWVVRACVMQGINQIWAAALWYWGFKLQGADAGAASSVMPIWINAITMPLGALCFFLCYVLFVGLPNYYHQLPGSVPNFVKTLVRRKLVIWWLIAEVLRDYWLSGPYGRNWSFLWSTDLIPTWATALLVIFFFIILWAAIMVGLSRFAKEHTWLLPLVAIGLIAPRWAQMLWGTSGIGFYVPWAGSLGPYVAGCLWLWLGVLDAIQGVGLGLVLLQTLSRVHVAATLCLSQIIGSVTVIAARATAPDRFGPGRVFPNFGLSFAGFGYYEFWLALACQVAIVIGFLAVFRNEQLSKP